MTHKDNIQQSANKTPEPAKKKSSGNWMVPAGVALICAGIFYWAMFGSGAPASQNGGAPNSSAPAANTSPAQNAGSPAHFNSAEEAQPYPQTLDPKQFGNRDVAHAYQVAKEIPGVLAQQPCYCYCSVTAGHRGLLDCWTDLHGSICDICVKEALLTERLNKLGLKPDQIREAIMRGDWQSVNVQMN
jgi:hypothetical protein